MFSVIVKFTMIKSSSSITVENKALKNVNSDVAGIDKAVSIILEIRIRVNIVSWCRYILPFGRNRWAHKNGVQFLSASTLETALRTFLLSRSLFTGDSFTSNSLFWLSFPNATEATHPASRKLERRPPCLLRCERTFWARGRFFSSWLILSTVSFSCWESSLNFASSLICTTSRSET